MIDLVKLILVAGDGGNGRVSFRRERRVPKGGPDGGDGGKGGNIIFRGNKNLATLKHFSGRVLYEAENGSDGAYRKRIGAKGKDLVLEVPLGTSIGVVAENHVARKRRKFIGINEVLKRDGVIQEKYYLEKEGQGVPEQDIDPLYLSSTDEEIDPDVQTLLTAVRKQTPIEQTTITTHNQEVVVCQGGFGGRGNDRFKGSTNTTPLEAEYGSFGEKRVIILELRLLADVGLVGFPNAGKSTLLSVVTKAKPKIASYPFTTIEPNLGILDFSDYQSTSGLKEIVLADVPGLIEGASDGKGLGFEFLRHIENCSTILFVLALNEVEVFDETTDNTQKAQLLLTNLRSLQHELKKHKKVLEGKQFLVSINKIDLYSAELIAEIKTLFKKENIKPILFSAATKIGLEDLAAQLRKAIS